MIRKINIILFCLIDNMKTQNFHNNFITSLFIISLLLYNLYNFTCIKRTIIIEYINFANEF